MNYKLKECVKKETPNVEGKLETLYDCIIVETITTMQVLVYKDAICIKKIDGFHWTQNTKYFEKFCRDIWDAMEKPDCRPAINDRLPRNPIHEDTPQQEYEKAEMAAIVNDYSLTHG
jgi:hypothetical protein